MDSSNQSQRPQGRHSGWVDVPNGDLKIKAYVSEPAKPGPIVVVIQEIFGVNAHIRSVVKRVADAGFYAIAPAIFQRTAPHFEVGYSPADVAEGQKHKALTHAETLISDVRATIEFARKNSSAKFGKVGTVGFCFGGHVAYLVSQLEEVGATASFYGAGIARVCPGGGAPTLERVQKIPGTLYAFFGGKDPLIPKEDVEIIKGRLKVLGSQHRVFEYPEVGHGFACDARGDFNSEASREAWGHTFKLFREKL